MKKLKRNKNNKAFGAIEYTIIVSLVIVISLILLNLVRGNAGDSISSLDKATSAAENALGFSGSESGGGAVSSISVDFSGPFNYDFEDEIEVAVQDYFTNHATVRKSGEVVSNYSLSGITRAGNFIQVDIEVDGETARKQFAINEICYLATDDDFSGTTNGDFKYIGFPKCVEIPHEIRGVEITSYRNMFNNTDVKKVISTNLNITDTRWMFYYSQATSLNLSNFDTSNVINMSGMFTESQATTLDLSSFNTSKVTNMSYMFQGSQATTLDLSSFNTSNVINMEGMLSFSQATSLDLSSFDTSKVTDMGEMFVFSQATTLDLSSFDFSKADVFWIFNNSQTTEVFVKDEASQTILNDPSNKPAHTIISIK